MGYIPLQPLTRILDLKGNIEMDVRVDKQETV